MFEPAPTDVFFALLIAFSLVMGPRVLRFSGSGPLVFVGIAVFLWGNLVSMMQALNVQHAVGYLVVTAFMVAMFIVLVGLIGRFGPRFAYLCLRAYCLAALLASVTGILARFHLLPNWQLFFLDASYLRIRSTFKDANVFAPFVAAASVVVLDDLVTGRRSKLSAGVHATIHLVAILFAFSRGAFLNLAVAVFIYSAAVWGLLRVPAISRRLAFGLALGAVLAAAAGVYALVLSGTSRFLDERLALQDYDRVRFAMQATTLHTAVEYPLGLGPGEWVVRYWMDPHNVYLRILAENGLIGLLGFLTWMGAAALKAIGGILRRSAHAPTYAAAMAIFGGNLAESVVIDTLHWRHLFVFVAVPVGLAAHELSEARASSRAAGQRARNVIQRGVASSSIPSSAGGRGAP